MRIAMIGQKGIPAAFGGVERHVEELSKELAKQGHEILVYTRSWYARQIQQMDTPTNDLPANIRVITTPSIHTQHLDTITHTFVSLIHAATRKPDVIHLHGVGPALLSWLPRLISPRTRVIATFHSMDRYQYKWGFFSRWFLSLGEKFICRYPDRTITVSRGIYHYCLNQFGKPTDYIPSGVPAYDGKTYPEIIANWKLQLKKYVLTVSRLIPGKGIHHLISAWRTLRLDHPDRTRDLRLAIVGEGEDKYLNELYALSGSDDSIVFTGAQYGHALQSLIANARLFAHPSENEGLPIAVLEAMSMGLPVIVSDIPGHCELIRDSRFWFHTGDVADLSDKLGELIGDDEALSHEGAQNQILAQKKYSWQDSASKIEKIYKK